MGRLRLSNIGLGLALLCTAACQRTHGPQACDPGTTWSDDLAACVSLGDGDGTREDPVMMPREDAAASEDPQHARDAAMPLDAEVTLDGQVMQVPKDAEASSDADVAVDAAAPHEDADDAHVTQLPDAAQEQRCPAVPEVGLAPVPDEDRVHGASILVACGLNGRGTRELTCSYTIWSSTDCDDYDVCTDGDARSSTCGINGRGALVRSCVAGDWVNGACNDPDECDDGTFQTVPCGGPGVGRRRCALGHWAAATCIPPTPHFIPIPAVRDIVHDAKRKRLYITTTPGFSTNPPADPGEVLVYDLANETLEEPLITGQRFFGIDLSPDQNRLIVADNTIADGRNRLHLINLESDEVDTLEFELEHGEGGMFTAVFLSDDEVLATSTYQGSGWVPMRRVDLRSGEAENVASVRQATMLTRSADGSTVAFAESNISSGAWGLYSPSAETFAHAGTGWFVYEVAISRDAGQIAVPTYGGLFVFDGELEHLTTIGQYAVTLPIGAVYSPVADEIYFAWYGAEISIDVYSTETLEPIREIAAEPDMFDLTGNHAFDNGRLRISRDGTLLFATTETGIAFYPTGL